jgi:hypothetical protein
MSGQYTEAAEAAAAAGSIRSSFRETIRQHHNKLSGTISSQKSTAQWLTPDFEDGNGTAQQPGQVRRSQQLPGHSSSGGRRSSSIGRLSMLKDVPPRQSHFDASRHYTPASIAADSGEPLVCKSVRKELGSPFKHPQESKQSKQLDADARMQPRTSSVARYGSPGALQQECVVTALLQQNDALQKQLQELLAGNQQQAAPAEAAGGAIASESGAGVQQLTANERRLVKVLKKMQKDKDR